MLLCNRVSSPLSLWHVGASVSPVPVAMDAIHGKLQPPSAVEVVEPCSPLMLSRQSWSLQILLASR